MLAASPTSVRMHHSTKHIFSTTNPNEYGIHENTNAPVLDFKRYENMVAHAMFSSSRRNGVRGIPFRDFLPCFLGEFEDTIWMKVAMSSNTDSTHQLANAINLLEGYHDSVGALAERTVPFLAPPNAKWPSYILATNADNCKFGHLVRPPNEERCDVYVVDLEADREKAMFVCECKYRGEKVDYGVIDGILLGLNKRWGEIWKVVIVFCTEVTSFQTWAFDTIGCVKIERGKDLGAAIANWIFQPELEKRKKLMIIVETGLITAASS
ncbi:hypothetical protein ON010_g14617 [Phytophthora cinnamomi]|nr:hypothetical protein ON010_g14617 [Phytophthora cinnamomi]